jgi:hypothetical protein
MYIRNTLVLMTNGIQKITNFATYAVENSHGAQLITMAGQIGQGISPWKPMTGSLTWDFPPERGSARAMWSGPVKGRRTERDGGLGT